MSTIWATVVLYHPDKDTLDYVQQLQQWVQVVVVDNTPVEIDSLSMFEHYIANSANKGIAKALNQGMQYAMNRGADWCLLLDQDSRLDRQQLMTLVEQVHVLQSPDVAAIAPVYFDTNTQRFGNIITFSNRKLVIEKVPLQDNLVFEPAYVISSGSCVNLSACRCVGFHDESLFIDFVDIEWGLRARSRGFKLLMTTKVCMTHSIGDEPISIMGRKVVNHSPVRHYYYFRNLFLLLRKNHIPWVWKVRELLKLPVRFFIYSLLTTRRWSHFRSMSRGFFDGLLGKSGQ
ncbi:glycosyltransferase family 2 protein [Vibrio atypicus]|uniref:glycosyltransferase family 2 protein n=1 Tax=Vibrio atypicus TaxID=558271 RepID=UPI0037354F8C